MMTRSSHADDGAAELMLAVVRLGATANSQGTINDRPGAIIDHPGVADDRLGAITNREGAAANRQGVVSDCQGAAIDRPSAADIAAPKPKSSHYERC
jgi:hypothetical protein